MPIGEKRLYNLEPGSSAYDFRLQKVQKEIRAGAVQFEQKLCAGSGITLDRLHELLESYTIREVDAAIGQWGLDFEAHLGHRIGKREDLRAPGFRVKWEVEHDQ